MTHLTQGQFQQLYSGGLDAEEMAAILRHLDGCEACLDRLDQRLEGEGVSLAIEVRVEDFQHKLFQRIHREEATRAVSHLCFNYVLRVFALLIAPFFATGPKKSPAARR